MGAILLLFRWLPIVGIWNCGKWGGYNLAKNGRSLLNPVPIAESTAHWSPIVHKPRLCHGPWRKHGPVHDNPYMCGAIWNVEHSLAMVLLNIYNPTHMNETQNLVENNRFEIKNETENQAQSIPKWIRTLTVLRCICGPNLKSWLRSVVTYGAEKFTSSNWGKFWLWI